jgi:hypothetical protein
MSSTMKTVSRLMGCRYSQTACATRKLSLILIPNIYLLPSELKFFLLFCKCRYARCTRAVSVGKSICQFHQVLCVISQVYCCFISYWHCNIYPDPPCGTVPPAYYAHLAAFRGRYYNEQGSPAPDGTSVVGGDAAAAGDDPPACRRLPQIKENVKEVMFFC